MSSPGDPDDGAERRAFAARAGRRRPKGRSRNRGRRTCLDRSVGRRGTDRHPRGPALLLNCHGQRPARTEEGAPPSVRTRDRRSSICIVPAPVFGRRMVRPHRVHGSTAGPEHVHGSRVGLVEPLRRFVVGRCVPIAHQLGGCPVRERARLVSSVWTGVPALELLHRRRSLTRRAITRVESTQATHQSAAARKPAWLSRYAPRRIGSRRRSQWFSHMSCATSRDSTGVLMPTGVVEVSSRSQSSHTTSHRRSARCTIFGW